MEDDQLIRIENKLKSIDEVMDQIFDLNGKGWEVADTLYVNPADRFTDGRVEIRGWLQESRTHYYWMKDGRRYSFERWCEVTDKTQEEIMLLKLRYE